MTSQRIVSPKKLIEVTIPLGVINAEAARAKRKSPAGYPTTVHCWFAQRPIAAARAILFAQLVNDPSWKYSEAELKKPQVRGAITKKRNELFKLMAELVPWANVMDARVLRRAEAEIRSSWRETCEANKNHPNAATIFSPERLPVFSDPFAGGGSIPLEAQRLGLNVNATDLNPVAVLINKVLVEIPPKFAGRPPVGPVPASEKQTKAQSTEDWSGAKGLGEDVRRYGHWMRDEGEKRIGYLYPKVNITKQMVKDRADLKAYEGDELTVVAYIWARTVRSPNPAFSNVDVPLVSSFVLSTKAGKESWVKPIVDKSGYRFTVHTGKPPAGASDGTKLSRGANFKCLMSPSPIVPEHVYAEANAGRMKARLMALVVEGARGRLYLSPTREMEETAASAKPTWSPTLEMPDNPRWFSPPLYGLKTYGDLFTPRQLVALTTFSDLVTEARAQVMKDAVTAGLAVDSDGLEKGGAGAVAYADSVATFLAFAVDRFADYGSTISTWRNKDSAMRSTLGKQAIPMSWDYAEGSPFGASSAGFSKCVDVVARVLEFLPAKGVATASQADAQTRSAADKQIISTDPPYYDNIGYADLSDFFYVWLRRTLRPIFPGLFATLAVPKAEELVATPYRHGGREKAEAFFLEGMTTALRRLAEQTEPTTPITIYYAFKQSETVDEGTGSTGWETFLEALLRAGLVLTGTWPVTTEGDNRQVGNDANALASSIVLVCRRRAEDAGVVARKDFLRELERTLPVAIEDMTADVSAAIAPVDLQQACIGPGMALFSKYNAVLEADGSPMTTHNALVHINKAIDDSFSHAEGELDPETRFCINWFDQFGFETGAFGVADVLARAKGTSVDGVKETGVLRAGKGEVRLFKVGELPKHWDPTGADRVSVWEACHQMCRALGESEGSAGALLAKMPRKQEAIRLLAYRLYTLCERKRWAEQAGAYNELIMSWPAIVDASHGVGHVGTQMDLV